MRTTLRALLIIVLFALGACGRTTPFTPPPATPTPAASLPPTVTPPPLGSTAARSYLLGEPLTLGVGETVFVALPEGASGGAALQLTFERVLNDSRCPRLVACVVAGDATLALVVRLDDQPPEAVEAHTNPQPRGLPLAYGRYAVRVLDLQPLAAQPGDQIDPASYEVRLVVTAGDGQQPAPTEAARQGGGQVITPLQIDACSLVEEQDIVERFGPLAERPLADATPTGGGQQCVFVAERGTVTLAWYGGDAARAEQLVEELQAAGASITTVDENANGFEAAVQSQGRLALVRQFADRVLVAALRLDSQAQEVDWDALRASLDDVQLIALTRYAAGQTTNRTRP